MARPTIDNRTPPRFPIRLRASFRVAASRCGKHPSTDCSRWSGARVAVGRTCSLRVEGAESASATLPLQSSPFRSQKLARSRFTVSEKFRILRRTIPSAESPNIMRTCGGIRHEEDTGTRGRGDAESGAADETFCGRNGEVMLHRHGSMCLWRTCNSVHGQEICHSNTALNRGRRM